MELVRELPADAAPTMVSFESQGCMHIHAPIVNVVSAEYVHRHGNASLPIDPLREYIHVKDSAHVDCHRPRSNPQQPKLCGLQGDKGGGLAFCKPERDERGAFLFNATTRSFVNK